MDGSMSSTQTASMADTSDVNLFDAIRENGTIYSEEKMKSCFQTFDKDRDGGLDVVEFGNLTRCLFCNEKGKPYTLSAKRIDEMFSVFDENKDGILDLQEFRNCWNNWIRQILFPVSALLIVDVQNDFISGTLAVHNCPAGHDGSEVVPVINKLIDSVQFDAVLYSLDWHPREHISFFENIKDRKVHTTSKVSTDKAKVFDTVVFEGPPLTLQKLWPAHCIQESWGSKLHVDLKMVADPIFIRKGTNPDVDSYSAFRDNNKTSSTNLLAELQQRNITDIYVCGLAYDICVAATAKDALEYGYRISLVDDACRGVSLDDIQHSKSSLMKGHAVVVNSAQVKAMVLARDRRPELGYKAALTLNSQTKSDK